MMKKTTKIILYTFIGIILLILFVGIVKFNFINDDVYYLNGNGEYINDYGKTIEFENQEKGVITNQNNKLWTVSK